MTAGPPEVTVLLVTGPQQATADTLADLASQTLAPELFEVVAAGLDEGDARAARERHPHLALRTIDTVTDSDADADTDLELALDAARGVHVTVVHAGDAVSPGYLDALLAHAEPGVVPVAGLGGHAGSTLAATELPEALSLTVGTLTPTVLAREAGFHPGLGADAALVFWARLLARRPFRFHVLGGDTATYTRADRAGSAPEPAYESHVTATLEALAALDDVEPASPEAEAVLGLVTDRLCGRIHDHLVARPADRPAVVAAVEARPPRRFDWSAVNRGEARDLALLYCFTPWNGTGGMVAARRVRERGVVVDVIAKNMDGPRDVDLTSNAIAAPYVDVQRNLDGPVSAFDWDAVVAYSDRVFATLEADPFAGKQYRSVYSRAMWPPSHFVTAQYKLRHPAVHWIAEFSDPLDRNVNGEPRKNGTADDDAILKELREGIRHAGFTPPEGVRLFQWAEWAAYALADEIVFTNENQREYMLGYCDDSRLADRVRAVSRVSHHPSPPAWLYDVNPTTYDLDPERVHLGYFGAFYPTRGLDELTGALRALPGADRSRVRLHVFTKKSGRVREEVRAAGLADVVAVNPYVDYTAFLNLTRRFDALLVNDARTADAHDGINPYLPSKVSDYLGSGTPIWALYEPGSVLSTLPVPYRSALGDADAAAETLRAIIAAGRDDRTPTS